MRINPTSSTPSLPEMRETRSLIDWLSQVVTLNRALTHPAFPAVPIASSSAGSGSFAYNDADAIVVPVGGGGLLAGILIAVKSLKPSVRVIAAEPEWANDAFRSLQSGQIEPVWRTDTIADGLRTPLGSLTFPIIYQLVDEILCASEAAISEAMHRYIDRHAIN